MEPTKRAIGEDGPWIRGALVRLVGDPQQIGAFQAVSERAGRRFARIQAVTGIVQWPLDQIELVPAAREEPVAFLRNGRLSEPSRLRQVLAHIRLTGRLADVFYSMEATNTEFHAHQFKPVLKALASPTGNLLIADEVGLGKTIEAGLIWTEMRARFDYRRLLVLCPKALCTKWRSELISKFDIDAKIYNCSELLDAIKDRTLMSRSLTAICSLQGIKPPRNWHKDGHQQSSRPSSQLARFLSDRANAEPLFDMLIVDEAHHLRNPKTQSNELAHLLGAVVQSKVYLSATPIHLRNRDLFSLLTLLDPETYRVESDLDHIIEANRPLVQAREAALAGASPSDVHRRLEEAARNPLLASSQQLQRLLSSFEWSASSLSRADRAQLASDLEQVNLLANTVTRTRRRDVQELRIVRKVLKHRTVMAPLERSTYNAMTIAVQEFAKHCDIPDNFLLATPQRMLASCLAASIGHWQKRTNISVDEGLDEDIQYEDLEDSDRADARPLLDCLTDASSTLPAPSELERVDTKFQILLDFLTEFFSSNPGEKVVVFSTFRPTLRYLARRLPAANIGCEIIHGGVADRDASLKRFEQDGDVRVLLCSEVGSEGIDLQFSRTVVNYDLPWNPMRVEQRIGRVDRLGQTADAVTVVNLLHRDTIDDVIYDRLFDRLKLCKRALGGFEAVLGDEIAKLTPDLLSGRLGADELARRIDQTSQAIENRMIFERELEEEASALVAHGDHILNSIHAARELHRWIGIGDVARYVADALSAHFRGCTVRDLGKSGLYEIRLTQEARDAYGAWLRAQRLPRRGPLERQTGDVPCQFGRPPRVRAAAPTTEAITQTHPFVRFLAARVADTDAAQLRPAVAARVVTSAIRGSAPLPLGRYAVLAMLWRFGGLVDQERIAYAGLRLPDGALLEPDDAERLLLAAAESGTRWHEADSELDCRALADQCDRLLAEQLAWRFAQEQARREAELNDRVEIQLRVLEKKFLTDKTIICDTITKINERSRRKSEQINQKSSGNERAIQMHEGKLRKLEEAYRFRRSEIEKRRVWSAQEEQLAVAAIEVV